MTRVKGDGPGARIAARLRVKAARTLAARAKALPQPPPVVTYAEPDSRYRSGWGR